jgi:hypothetical protein
MGLTAQHPATLAQDAHGAFGFLWEKVNGGLPIQKVVYPGHGFLGNPDHSVHGKKWK